MRIALLSMFCVVACTGPGLEPPKSASTDNPNNGGSGGSAGAGAHGGSGGLGSGGSGGNAVGGVGGVVGGQGGAGGMTGVPASGGMDGDGNEDLDAGATDAAVDAGDVETDPTRDLDTGWSDACGDVTTNGHCVGDVYEWCDYFARGLKQLDCGELGMTCQAGLQPGDGVQTNGCIGDPCTADDEVCDGNLRIDCHDGNLLVTDCHKWHGPESSCELFYDDFQDREYIRCARDQPCDTPNLLWCDEEIAVICDEEGKLYLRDCQAHATGGRCVVQVGSEPTCDPSEFE